VAPYLSSSTPQDLAVRTYTYGLLAGDGSRPVHLELVRPAGTTLEVDLPRTGYPVTRSYRANRDTVIEGNIGYLRLDSFSERNAAAFVGEALARLADTDGLIVDVRLNGGGSSWPGYRLLTILMDTAFAGNTQWVIMPDPLFRARDTTPRTVTLEQDMYSPDDSIHYRRPVVVLASAMTFSAAEDFVSAFAALNRGSIIGEATAGSTGQPYSFRLPGDGSARVRTKHDRMVDGRDFIGVGVQPDIVVQPTIADIAAGRDPVLEAAIREIHNRK